MNVRYLCPCLADERHVEVRDRGDTEDIIEWMEGNVIPTVANDHRFISPRCQMTKLTYLKIPIAENADGIGMKPKLNG